MTHSLMPWNPISASRIILHRLTSQHLTAEELSIRLTRIAVSSYPEVRPFLNRLQTKKIRREKT